MPNQNFHPRLIISDHFNEIINLIDVKTEILLENQSLAEETRNDLNKTRERQIEKIKEIESINLNKLPFKFDEIEYRNIWSHVIDDDSIDYENKLDLIKEEIITFDCVLFEQTNLKNGLDLWITACFFNEKNLQFLR
jgi:hypothetical protein